MVAEIAVVAMVLSMLAVFLVSWKWTGSLRSAFIIMLITGKVWAGILYAFGIDKPLFNIIIYNKIKGVSSSVTVTADQFIFVSFFFTLLFTLLWPIIAPSLPPWLRGINLIHSGGEKK
ncbi:MAG: hypothetical protein J7L82_02370 [Staphylothermus sp.]|nr:hypothetical protein [Staphylothermus sp.]